MSIFSRIFKIGEAAANKAINSLEKPELMLEQAIRDKEKQIIEAKKAVQGLIASERQAKKLLNKELENKTLWEKKAESALLAGKEDLAVKALARSEEHEKKNTSMQTSWSTQKDAVEKLKQDIFKLEDELSEFKRNKDYIIAQSKVADVKKQIYEAKAKMVKGSGADDLMARMKAKAERANFEADAAEEMAESFGGGDSLEKEFAELSDSSISSSSSVQDKLAMLKAKIGK